MGPIPIASPLLPVPLLFRASLSQVKMARMARMAKMAKLRFGPVSLHVSRS